MSKNQIESEKIFKDSNIHDHAGKPESQYEQYRYKLFENNVSLKKHSKENLFVSTHVDPDLSSMYAEPFTLKNYNNKTYESWKIRTESEKKNGLNAPGPLFTFEDDIQNSTEKSHPYKEISGGPLNTYYETKIDVPPYQGNSYKTAATYSYSDHPYEPYNPTIRVEASFISPNKESIENRTTTTLGQSQYTYGSSPWKTSNEYDATLTKSHYLEPSNEPIKLEVKKKKILPNPFIKVEAADNNGSKELKQETPRCLYMSKGKMTPRSNQNTTFIFKPVDSANNFEVKTSKISYYEKPNDISEQSKPYEYQKEEFYKPSTMIKSEDFVTPSYAYDFPKDSYVLQENYKTSTIIKPEYVVNPSDFSKDSYVRKEDINKYPWSDTQNGYIFGTNNYASSDISKPFDLGNNTTPTLAYSSFIKDNNNSLKNETTKQNTSFIYSSLFQPDASPNRNNSDSSSVPKKLNPFINSKIINKESPNIENPVEPGKIENLWVYSNQIKDQKDAFHQQQISPQSILKDFSFKPIYDENKTKTSPEKKVKINVLPSLFKNDQNAENSPTTKYPNESLSNLLKKASELENNSPTKQIQNQHLSNLMKKASELINESNEDKIKTEETIKSEKLLSDVLDLLKKSEQVTSPETSPFHNVSTVLGVRQVVSIPFKQQKILRTNTNLSIGNKNWTDFPCVRSVSLGGTEESTLFKEEFMKELAKSKRNEESPKKTEKSENNTQPLKKELSMDDLPMIVENEKIMTSSNPIGKQISFGQNDSASRKKSKSFDLPQISNTLNNMDVSSQKLEKVECEIGSQSEIMEKNENPQISLDEEILKSVNLEDKKPEILKKSSSRSSPNRNSVSAFRNSNLNLEIEAINEDALNKPKSHSDFIKVTRGSIDSDGNISDISKSQRIGDTRASKKISFDESKIIIFEEANLPNVSNQGESLSEIEEENNEPKIKGSVVVRKRDKGNYFKKLRNMKKKKDKDPFWKEEDFCEEETGKKNKDKWENFQPSKRKGKNVYATLREQRKKKLELQKEQDRTKWGEFLPRKKATRNYFRKLKGKNKEKNMDKEMKERDEEIEKEEKKGGKKNYFSLLRQKKADDKKNRKEKNEEKEVERKIEKWDKFSPLLRKKKNQTKFKVFKDDKIREKGKSRKSEEEEIDEFLKEETNAGIGIVSKKQEEEHEEPMRIENKKKNSLKKPKETENPEEEKVVETNKNKKDSIANRNEKSAQEEKNIQCNNENTVTIQEATKKMEENNTDDNNVKSDHSRVEVSEQKSEDRKEKVKGKSKKSRLPFNPHEDVDGNLNDFTNKDNQESLKEQSPKKIEVGNQSPKKTFASPQPQRNSEDKRNPLDSATKNSPASKTKNPAPRRETEDFPDYAFENSQKRKSTFQLSNQTLIKVPDYELNEISQVISQQETSDNNNDSSILAPMKPKIAVIASVSVKKNEGNDTSYNSTVSLNQPTNYDSLDSKPKTPAKNKKFSIFNVFFFRN